MTCLPAAAEDLSSLANSQHSVALCALYRSPYPASEDVPR
ncbi:hypothetical protein RO3G_06919 [Rhizopus delemar RA 99-880]|uniref:Uncharacterized protein n=1 Tax=Rhizopus delemar (strain RA 99-880 / ATCC MYA-4621 / FGSC 9543 / NRRL 43880) TaxID=246409 RepID=I1C184_RHIO9|nr:hypothetical protein RO3G_06919 [Rhizopus delemar RA 99-880]|eukprot:EIE82214.1 hypothetical protein RO3G_06919 [Rhizopus delemar RA 99-880]